MELSEDTLEEIKVVSKSNDWKYYSCVVTKNGDDSGDRDIPIQFAVLPEYYEELEYKLTDIGITLEESNEMDFWNELVYGIYNNHLSEAVVVDTPRSISSFIEYVISYQNI